MKPILIGAFLGAFTAWLDNMFVTAFIFIGLGVLLGFKLCQPKGKPMNQQDLPPELIAQLSKPHKNTGDMPAVLEAMPNEFNVDDILVKHWVVSGKIIKRNTMLTRLGNLVKQGVLTRSNLPYTFVKVIQK